MMLPTIGDIVNQRYEIVGVLARGGMGIVYRGRQLPMNRDIAIKMVLPEIQNSEKHLERFRREVEIAMRLKHPSIVEIYDFGHTDDGLLFIIMEYLDGRDLKSVLINEGALSVGHTRTILENVLDALCVAHQERVIHRDLKPSNIMMTRVGRGREFPKILDFGIAKSVGDHTELTMSGEVLGSIPYLAPEGLRGDPVGFSSDVYSMGLIALEMLTGTRVRQGANTAQIVTQHLTMDVEIPRQLRGTALETFLRKACSRDAHERFPDAMHMYDAMEQAFKGIDPELVCIADTVPSMSYDLDVAPTTANPSQSLHARPTIPAPMVFSPNPTPGQPTAPTFAPHLNPNPPKADSGTDSVVAAPQNKSQTPKSRKNLVALAIAAPFVVVAIVAGAIALSNSSAVPNAPDSDELPVLTTPVDAVVLPQTEPEAEPSLAPRPEPEPAMEAQLEPEPTNPTTPEKSLNLDDFKGGMDDFEKGMDEAGKKVKHNSSTSKTKKDADPFTVEKF